MKLTSVFISYSSKDVASAELLEKLLTQQGLDVWRDKTRLRSGEKFGDKIRQAVTASQKVIVLWSPQSLVSDWVLGEAELARDQGKYLGYLIKGCTAPQLSLQFWRYHHPTIANWRSDIDEVLDVLGAEKTRDGKSRIVVASPSLHRLPSRYASEIIGRDPELDALSAAWDTGHTKVISIEAMGGTGKTTLVQKWLDVMANQGWRGATKVFAYSFYEQGTDENPGGDATEFFDLALRYFGYDGPPPANDSEKAEILAELASSTRSLLILDGIEPLQYPSHSTGLAGKLRNPGLSVLLRQLIHQDKCLCIVTTRIQIAGLRTQGTSVDFRRLQPLNRAEGVALLRSIGVRGSDTELEAAVVQNDGYALALSLLGRHVVEFAGGDIAMAVPVEDVPIRSDERSLQRVMRRYEVSFEERIKEQELGGTRRNDTAAARQLELLRLLGLFNRPCSIAALLAITAGVPLKGLVEACSNIDANKLRFAVHELRRIGLILPAYPDAKDDVDAHPSVRGHYTTMLATPEVVPPESVKAAHGRLYHYFKSIMPTTPRTLSDFVPVYSAISHGAIGNQFDEAISDLLVGVVLNRAFRAPSRIGAHGTLLTSISGYFSKTYVGSPDWSKPNDKLQPKHQVSILTAAGFSLRALGRMGEAVVAFAAAAKVVESGKVDARSIISARRHLSMALLESGRISEALPQVDLAGLPVNKVTNHLSLTHSHITLGQILHARGELQPAHQAYREAERLLVSPQRPLIRGRGAFHLHEVLLELGEVAEAQRRGREIADQPLSDQIPLDQAFELMLQSSLNARARRFSEARKQTSLALSLFRENGESTCVPMALLQRAELERRDAHLAEARSTLRECGSVLEDSGLLLLSIDCALEQIRYNLDMLHRERPGIMERLNPSSERKRTWNDTMSMIEDVQARINDAGYLRRALDAQALRDDLVRLREQ